MLFPSTTTRQKPIDILSWLILSSQEILCSSCRLAAFEGRRPIQFAAELFLLLIDIWRRHDAIGSPTAAQKYHGNSLG